MSIAFDDIYVTYFNIAHICIFVFYLFIDITDSLGVWAILSDNCQHCWRVLTVWYDCRKAARMEEDEYKTPNQSYYNMAHSSMERVTEQPTLLVGGSLKEYQVTAERMHYTNISNAVQVVFILGLVRLINYLCSTVSLYQMLHFEEQILCNFFARLIFVEVCVLASHSELKTDFCYLYSAKTFCFG